jgi:hypothetical protein
MDPNKAREEQLAQNGWIGVDLDGTLAYYDKNDYDPLHIGYPLVPMVRRVKAWIKEGKDVRIFTARVDGGGAAISMGNDATAVGELYADVAEFGPMYAGVVKALRKVADGEFPWRMRAFDRLGLLGCGVETRPERLDGLPGVLRTQRAWESRERACSLLDAMELSEQYEKEKAG